MASVEPIPDVPAAVVETHAGRSLAFADFHAGLESALRYERGVNVDSRGPARRERVLELVAEHDVDDVIVVGDFMHSIGGPGGAERGEIEVLLESLSVPVTVVKGNHDGELAEWAAVSVTDAGGVRVGDVGFVHGHTWPSLDVLAADVVCVGHEHPRVRLTDEVGGSRVEPVWLRGAIDASAFADRDGSVDDTDSIDGELVVFPAFNELCGGTWVNENSDFLAPFLPAALPDGQAYLLDGTRLGDYREL
jgi:putative SbcD/Mre11-related phosphoesterase